MVAIIDYDTACLTFNSFTTNVALERTKNREVAVVGRVSYNKDLQVSQAAYGDRVTFLGEVS